MRAERFVEWLTRPPVDGPASIALLRAMAGGVFLWEGILKFVYVNQLGFPEPALTAHFVGTFEIVGGVLLLAGLLTRIAAIPFVVEMLVAMLSTKVALFLGHSPLAPPSSPPLVGAWAVLHEVRSEWAQLLTVTFLAINGPGRWSLDALFARARTRVRRDAQSPLPA
jgi:putative oxidoreductase